MRRGGTRIHAASGGGPRAVTKAMSAYTAMKRVAVERPEEEGRGPDAHNAWDHARGVYGGGVQRRGHAAGVCRSHGFATRRATGGRNPLLCRDRWPQHCSGGHATQVGGGGAANKSKRKNKLQELIRSSPRNKRNSLRDSHRYTYGTPILVHPSASSAAECPGLRREGQE